MVIISNKTTEIYILFTCNSDDSSLAESTESIMIEEHPKSQEQREGSTVEFKCEVQGRKGVSYQWFKDRTTKLQGQNSAILVLDSVKLRDFGCYTCEVKSIDGRQCVESSPAMLDVTPGDGMSKFILSVLTSVQSPKSKIVAPPLFPGALLAFKFHW